MIVPTLLPEGHYRCDNLRIISRGSCPPTYRTVLNVYRKLMAEGQSEQVPNRAISALRGDIFPIDGESADQVAREAPPDASDTAAMN